MDKTFPTDEKLWLLMAEDVRVEQGNKITVLGWFAGGDILVPKGTKEIVLQSIVMILQMNDGFGEFLSKVRLLAPDGSVIFSTDEQMLTKTKRGATHAVKLVPFTTKQLGEYMVELKLDDKEYFRTFNILDTYQE